MVREGTLGVATEGSRQPTPLFSPLPDSGSTAKPTPINDVTYQPRLVAIHVAEYHGVMD